MYGHNSRVNDAHRKRSWFNALHIDMYKFGKDNFEIELIKSYPCENVNQVLREVNSIMDQLIRQESPLYNMEMIVEEENDAIYRPAQLKYYIREKKWSFIDLQDPSNLVEKTFSVAEHGYDLAKFYAEVERECIYPCKKYGGKMPVLKP